MILDICIFIGGTVVPNISFEPLVLIGRRIWTSSWFVGSSFDPGDVAMAGSTLLEAPTLLQVPVSPSLLVASRLELVQGDPTAQPRPPRIEAANGSPRAGNYVWTCGFVAFGCF